MLFQLFQTLNAQVTLEEFVKLVVSAVKEKENNSEEESPEEILRRKRIQVGYLFIIFVFVLKFFCIERVLVIRKEFHRLSFILETSSFIRLKINLNFQNSRDFRTSAVP